MWEGWRRVSAALTPVSVTLSWMWGQQPSSRDSAVPDLLRSFVSALQICRVYFDHDSRDARLLNNYSKVASTHHSPRGLKSQNHHPGMASSHRPPTCPRLLRAFLFPALISNPDFGIYFRPQNQTLRSTLPSSVADEASESERRCTKTEKARGESRRGETTLTTPTGERLMASGAVGTETAARLIYMILDPFNRVPSLCLSVLIPHRP